MAIDQLLFAIKYCIEDGNATGAYVYARMLARYYRMAKWIVEGEIV